eukprot:scaffold955_cov250-Pinguiococcus_pyrenoidosus.AAC.3
MRPAFENTGDHDGNINHLIYNMERACAMLRAKATGVEKLMLLVDYKNYSLFNAPPMKTSRATLDILQNHYPERLGCAMLLNPPFIFRAFWAAISPFIDPVTADKIQFVTGSESARLEHLSEYLDINKLEEGAGGRNTVPFDSQVRRTSGRDVALLLVWELMISAIGNRQAYMDSALHEDLEALLRPGGTSGSARSARGSVGSESRPVERTPEKPNEGEPSEPKALAPKERSKGRRPSTSAVDDAKAGGLLQMPNVSFEGQGEVSIALEGVMVILISLGIALFMTGRLGIFGVAEAYDSDAR